MSRTDLARIRDGRRTGRHSSYDERGRNADYWVIPPGESRVLADIRGPGIITHLWMTQPGNYRECLLRFTWDDARSPSVLCPLGDFFGLGHGIVNSYQSLLFTASTHHNNAFNKGCALNAYVPMPFRRRARIELVNESTEHHTQYFYVDYESCRPADLQGLGYLHAEFRRTNPFAGWAPEIRVNTPLANVVNRERVAWRNNYVILETRGRGHYLGCNLSVSNFQGTWWGEGDDMIWVDGYKWPPDLHGTGSEDYLNQAWGMQPNAFMRNGSSIHEDKTGGYQTSYVHHIENPVRFTREIKVTIEHGHGNHLGNEMSSVAYWYADKPTPVLAPPPVQQRLPVAKARGRWAPRARKPCPGQPVQLTPEMTSNKRKAVDEMKREEEVRRFVEENPLRSEFVTRWRVSPLLPPRALARVACPPRARTLRWRPRELGAAPTRWLASVHALYGARDGLVFLANRFTVEQSGTWTIHLGHDGGAKLFVDGRTVACEAARLNPAPPKRTEATVTLAAGTHDIVVALDTDEGFGWGIAFSFERRPGDPGRPFPKPA